MMDGTLRRFALIGSCVAVMVAGTLRAAPGQVVYVPDAPGKWVVVPPPSTPGGTLRPADLMAVQALDQKVYGIFRQVPILAAPKGFDVRPHSNFALEDMDGDVDSPHPKVVAGAFNVQLAPYIVENGRTYAFGDVVIGWISVGLTRRPASTWIGWLAKMPRASFTGTSRNSNGTRMGIWRPASAC
jgi:hypothetical protein